MTDTFGSGCTPDKCGGCPGCGGDAIEKISLRVEWKHKGETPEDPDVITTVINDLASELIVSGVELTYINNTFGADIPENSSAFLINGHPLAEIVKLEPGEVTKELLRKGIFQALLQNL
ncbi:hypothetical protein [Methanospirillum sp.]